METDGAWVDHMSEEALSAAGSVASAMRAVELCGKVSEAPVWYATTEKLCRSA